MRVEFVFSQDLPMSASTRNSFALPPLPRTQIIPPSATFVPPPLDGSITAIGILDWHYAQSPSHPFFLYAQSSESNVAITWKEVIEAVYTGTKLIHDRVQGGSKVVGILSQSDTIPYYTTVLAIMRANCIPFPISPRNSPQAVAHLINKVGVAHVLVGYDQKMQQLMERATEFLKEEYHYATDNIPTSSMVPVFEDLYLQNVGDSKERIMRIKEEIPLKEVQPLDVQIYLHSSGSTAFPKPIPWTARGILELLVSALFGRNVTGKVMSMHAIPAFHAMGTFHIFLAAATGMIFGTFAPQLPPVQPTPENAFKGAVKTNVDYILCVPSIIEEWSLIPSYVEWLATRSGIFYGGGPLDKETGDRLSKQGVPVSAAYGLTECGVVSQYLPEEIHKDAWNYFRLGKHIKTHLIPSDDNTYELIILAGGYASPQVFNTTIDGVEAYSTSDLIIEHPKLKGYWKILGRADSQIIHSSGEKTNPAPLESMMNQDPHVSASVMFGQGKFQAGILVEPIKEEQFDPKDQQKLSEFRNKIWPTVQRMNAYAPQHSRIFKEMILVASPSKPFTYTAKNTTRNPAIIREYAPEIEALYDSLEESTQASIPAPTQWDLTSSMQFVRAVVQKVLIVENIGDEDDIFQRGGDSLQATWIKNSILRALRDSAKIDTREATGNFVYEHPTIASLAAFVSSAVHNGTLGGARGFEAQVKADVEGMRQMVEKYSKNFASASNEKLPTNDRKVVLMTGSTGGVGAHILARLLEDATVEKVYALIRKGSVDINTKQVNAFVERGVDVELIKSGKLILLEANLSEKKFGLEEGVFEKLEKSITHIIANAWRVDFNLGLASFESDIKGLRNMVDLALATSALIVFVSSVGIFQRFMYAKTRPFPEAAVPAEVASAGGYAQSKWVSEEIIQHAASTAGLRSVIIRLGQACGSPNGSWNSKEWLPAIVNSAPILGCIPDDNRLMSWIPADVVACAIRDFLDVPEVETRDKSVFVHLIHPRPIRWSTLARIIASRLKVDVVPFAQWLERLEHVGRIEQDAEKKISALRILPSYQSMASVAGEPGMEAFGIPEIENERAKALSKTLADPNLPQLGQENLDKWLSYWGLD
ncbi:hypothetical protein VKT23_001674 [Stygiomarasmius scandens]|uniref:Carrier domain-containing protein n=1 Tax=Marasmiellus scandens TaxID=2682957 RepID=A0ABR1K2F6_9AGAR